MSGTAPARRRAHLTTSLALATLLLAPACSSGGTASGGTPTPTPGNQAPDFTSASAASIVENALDAYQATATDPDGNALTYSITGGADASRFTISAAGLLRFVSAPDYEAPADTGQDNGYDVQLSVSDGMASATLPVTITVTNSREGILVRRVGTGFNQPLYVAPIPGDTKVFVVEKGGNVLTLDPATGAKAPFITVSNISTDSERGLLSVAAAPDYQTTGFLYAYVTNPAGNIEIRRYRRANNGSTVLDATIITIPHPTNSNHNGGWLGFGPDGDLYFATGDGGGGGDVPNNAQNTNVLLGKLLRIALNPPGGSAPFYTIPADNPFASGAGGAREIFAYGLRNPFRASFSGSNLLIGDVGQDAWEEIDLVRPQDKGGNYGWHFREGAHPYTGTPPAGLIDPVLEYGHGTGLKQGPTITGGYVYRGPVTSLVGLYVFGDEGRGHIFTVPANTLVQGTTLGASGFERRNEDFAPDVGTIDQLASFGEDSAGNLYLVDLDGEVYMVTTV
jgi:glucose/arabinose dehydrogenase